ncbi:hypothetical protein PXD04_06235 [Methanosphaera sp. ISO3-F5]|nr:hypothetical protein [Methanosphaera sp. ISO3-F5]WQH63310.1 hypothetical protein PXD04_06235 [Methanosphaera sp. ISO3-F5]
MIKPQNTQKTIKHKNSKKKNIGEENKTFNTILKNEYYIIY